MIKNTSGFDTWSSSGVGERYKILKEEGSKKEDRQEVEVKQCSHYFNSLSVFF